MCLSTAYKNEVSEQTIIMKNVMNIEYINGIIVLTDLMERKMEINGVLKTANLMDNFIIIEEVKNEKA